MLDLDSIVEREDWHSRGVSDCKEGRYAPPTFGLYRRAYNAGWFWQEQQQQSAPASGEQRPQPQE